MHSWMHMHTGSPQYTSFPIASGLDLRLYTFLGLCTPWLELCTLLWVTKISQKLEVQIYCILRCRLCFVHKTHKKPTGGR